MKTIIGFLLAIALLTSCEGAGIVAEDTNKLLLDDQQQEQALAQEIEQYAQNKACKGSGCKSVGMGVKACGGPVKYLIYSLSQVDEKVLLSKINAYNALQTELNKKYNRVSDCMVALPPTVDCVNGLCTAQ